MWGNNMAGKGKGEIHAGSGTRQYPKRGGKKGNEGGELTAGCTAIFWQSLSSSSVFFFYTVSGSMSDSKFHLWPLILWRSSWLTVFHAFMRSRLVSRRKFQKHRACYFLVFLIRTLLISMECRRCKKSVTYKSIQKTDDSRLIPRWGVFFRFQL